MIKKNPSAKPLPMRRLATVREACSYGRFSHTKCYSLINSGRITAYKRDRQTFVDLDSIDAMHGALVPIEPRNGR
jgi:hypothetical protein